jgi:hypothetical protein
MEMSPSESAVLARFAEKCRAAGGPQAGQQVRRASFSSTARRNPGVDVDEGLSRLVEKGVLKATEKADRFFLTEAGVELVKGLAPGP